MSYINILHIILLATAICNSKGINWTKVFENDSLLFKGIDNSDSLNCIAFASSREYSKVILKSTDGGLTWNYILKDTNLIINGKLPKLPQDISYPTRDLCIVSLDSNSFLKTTDGGSTWKEYIIDVPYRHFGFKDVDMFDGKYGVMTTQYELAISRDGFQTWDTLLAPEGYYVFKVEMAGPNSICVLSRYIDGSPEYDEKFFRSDDFGVTWTEYPHPDYAIPMSLQFVDSLIGYEVGGKSTGIGNQKHDLVFKTTDGGHSWFNVLDTVIYYSFGLQKLDFYDKDNGITVGQFGSVFWTHDGGKSWVFDSSELIWSHIPATMNVCYIRKDRAIIADFDGIIYISSEDTTDVVENFPNDNNILLSPNPFSSSFNIDFTNNYSSNVSIDLYDILGNKIYTKNLGFLGSGQHSTTIQLNDDYSPGCYLLVIRSGAEIQCLKVVKSE
ncbi:MAG: T9SS type A sorting domain-containing protein [Bacteroidetes bacterium]|nr:MAG: T9SS type A sorting domain-containing protein [Bacteroidota bacterium]